MNDSENSQYPFWARSLKPGRGPQRWAWQERRWSGTRTECTFPCTCSKAQTTTHTQARARPNTNARSQEQPHAQQASGNQGRYEQHTQNTAHRLLGEKGQGTLVVSAGERFLQHFLVPADTQLATFGFPARAAVRPWREGSLRLDRPLHCGLRRRAWQVTPHDANSQEAFVQTPLPRGDTRQTTGQQKSQPKTERETANTNSPASDARARLNCAAWGYLSHDLPQL